MNRTPAQWAKIDPAAVRAGEPAQQENIMTMLKADIATLARALDGIMNAAEDHDIDACHELARRALVETR